MICFLEGPLLQRALSFFSADPYAIRGLAGVRAYGTAQPFVGAWTDDREKLLIGRTESALTVCGECTDPDELLSFLSITGGTSLLVPEGLLPEQLPGWRLYRTGVVLADPAPASLQPGIEDGAPWHMAAMLAEADSPWIEVGDRDALYTDLSHRMRHGCIHGRMLRQNGTPAACALTMGESNSGAVIGGVVCRPCFRGQGLAGRALSDLCAQLQREDKRIFLFTGAELTAYYQKFGFSVYGQWRSYLREEAAAMG